MSDDLHTLTGAYALGALPEAELERFEAHLADCEDCRNEVDEFLAASARIGAAAATPPPAELKARVLAGITETRQEHPPPDRSTREGGHRSSGGGARIWPNVTIFAVAATIIALIAVGITVLVQRGDVTEARSQTSRVSDVIAAPDARLIRDQIAGGGNAAVVVSGDRDTAVVVLSDLPPAAPHRTYQLWFIGADGARSAGTIDLHQPEQVTRVLTGLGATQTLGLTIEPHGGSPQPTTEPVLALEL